MQSVLWSGHSQQGEQEGEQERVFLLHCGRTKPGRRSVIVISCIITVRTVRRGVTLSDGGLLDAHHHSHDFYLLACTATGP